MASRDGDVINLDAVNAAITVVRVGRPRQRSECPDLHPEGAGAAEGANTVNAALDSSTGFLYLDLDDNGVIDSVIELTGVSTINAAAFVLV